jgi:oligosaccharide repeat unit polymerase
MELVSRLDPGFYLLVLLCWYIFEQSKRMHHGDWLNPLAVTVFLTIGVYTLLSYLAVLEFTESGDETAGNFGVVLRISTVYLLSIYIGYCIRKNPIRKFLYRPLSIYKIGAKSKKSSNSFAAVVLICAALSYAALMVSSGVGLLWITDTRSAYQLNRGGSGHWWLMYQWLVMIAFLLTISSQRDSPRRTLNLISMVLFYATLLYFSGSKGAVLSVLVTSTLYSHFFIRKISGLSAFLGASFLIFLFLTQLVMSGAYQDLAAAGAYFVDYFYFGAEFIGRIDEIGHRFGEGWLTSLWFYVPRALHPGKPVEYGLLLIHQTLFPGMAEEGTTPGIVGWALSYLDFGTIGVAAEGFLIGSFQRAVYIQFLRQKSIGLFIVLVSSCYFSILAYATPIIYLTIALVLQLAVAHRTRHHHI